MFNLPVASKSQVQKTLKKAEKRANKSPVKSKSQVADKVEKSDRKKVATSAFDRSISKKYPDYLKCVQLIEELKKQFPQTGLNGEKNIWILKPAQSSRGRGIMMVNNLSQIQQIAS